MLRPLISRRVGAVLAIVACSHLVSCSRRAAPFDESLWTIQRSDSGSMLIQEGGRIFIALNEAKVKKTLDEISGNPGRRGRVTIDLPSGKVEFEVTVADVGEAGYDSLTVGAQGLARDPSGRSLFITYGPRFGVSASILGGATPYFVERTDFGKSYMIAPHANEGQRSVICTSAGDSRETDPSEFINRQTRLLTFRIAVATTGEYSDYVRSKAPPNADASDTTRESVETVIRHVNHIYQRELGIRLLLVQNEEMLIATDYNDDKFDPNKDFEEQNQVFIDGAITSEAYDVGHLFTFGQGGHAQIACAGRANKAMGYSGPDEPYGAYFYVDLVAHELGHQFGARHSHSIDGYDPTYFEPGSGSTIMSYADKALGDVQSFKDPYFHYSNLQNMTLHADDVARAQATQFIAVSTTPSVRIETASTEVTTPFTLACSANDAESNALSYCWELAQSHKDADFKIRSLYPSVEPSRPVGGPEWEVLPKDPTALKFIVTVRDVFETPDGLVMGSWTMIESMVGTPAR